MYGSKGTFFEPVRRFLQRPGVSVPRKMFLGIAAVAMIWIVLSLTSVSVSPSSLRDLHLDKFVGYGGFYPRPKSKIAYATFLGRHAQGDPNSKHDDDDPYFVAARVLGHQLMHDPDTRTKRGIPFIVVTTADVKESKRRTLERDGAIVIVVEDLLPPAWLRTDVVRFGQLFTKLRLLEMTEYQRILYIDADIVLMRCMDDIFDDPAARTPKMTLFERRKNEIKHDEGPLPDQYLLAARPDNMHGGHPFPPEEGDYFNAGFWILAPSTALLDYYKTVMNITNRFDPYYMEQAMMNYAHRQDGPMPWSRLNYLWYANWPTMAEVEGGVGAVHAKAWEEGVEPIRERWERIRNKLKFETKAANIS